ncbi:hypothetical protein ACXIZN_11805 [Amycolatopsis sp. TRM77291]
MITVEEFVAALPNLMWTDREPIEMANDSSLVDVPTDWWRTESTNPHTEDEFEDTRTEEEQQSQKAA